MQAAKMKFKKRNKNLKKGKHFVELKDLLCITWDYEDELKEDGKTIKFIPLWKMAVN